MILPSTLQLSGQCGDFIVDCLGIQWADLKQVLKPLLHNENILKIMHGADNDLVLIKSCFNLTPINFIDTSRFDLELKEQSDLRGLATLVKEYLGINMSKEYQVSEWRIRPIPKVMLDYARKDSFILPYLLKAMID